MDPHSAMVSSQNINGEADHASRNWDEAVGTRFKPSDEILTRDYLVNFMSGSTDGPIFPLIKKEDVYQQEPSKLRNVAHNFKDGNMYFFSRLRKKYGKGKIFERTAGDGCWKKSKLPSDVKDGTGKVIGTKTSLVYYKYDQKRKPTIKTQWLMKEYMVPEEQNDELTKTTLCVVYYHDKKRKQFATAAATEDSGKRQRHSSCTSNNSPPLHGSSSPVPGATLKQSLPYDPNCCQNTPNMMNGFWGAPAPNHCAPLHSNSSPVAAATIEQSLPFDPNYCHNMPTMMNESWEDLTRNCFTPLNSSSSLVATNLDQSLPSDPNNFQNMPNMMNESWSTPALNYYPPSPSSLPSYSNDYQNMANQHHITYSNPDLLIQESGEEIFIEFPNNPHSQTQLDQFENNTITQIISVNNNEDPSCLNSAEHL